MTYLELVELKLYSVCTFVCFILELPRPVEGCDNAFFPDYSRDLLSAFSEKKRHIHNTDNINCQLNRKKSSTP